MPALNAPNVSVKVEIISISGTRLTDKSEQVQVSYDVKAKLEEKERKSQSVTIGFEILLSTKPGLAKFEAEGKATLVGKDDEIRRMLEVDPETKVPYVMPRIYQQVFMAMYLMSTILNSPPPPSGILNAEHQSDDAQISISTAKDTVENQIAQAVNDSTITNK